MSGENQTQGLPLEVRRRSQSAEGDRFSLTGELTKLPIFGIGDESGEGQNSSNFLTSRWSSTACQHKAGSCPYGRYGWLIHQQWY
ncbi:hypothetical protein [Phormidium sp. CCY1219]|uniref:hypothetical protein n=1 Tax=Phormidium sp. CCY1219 TaxID=2886104 RepID=UPI002D1E6967|nr:hypothetical protein [Phormidium sp. CCY1219]MEB3827496.1 hypothetical protein [Phormidium sp. CCY1219]